MRLWWKWIPHPTCGNYFGKALSHNPDDGVDPTSDLDAACQMHDYTGDDQLFIDMLETIDMDSLTYYEKCYRNGALFFFKLFRGQEN